MGKIKDGNISGAVGNLVFAGNIVRSKPKKIENWSEAQQQQRGKLSSVIALYRDMSDFVKEVWSHKVVEGLTPYNRFIKLNIGAFDKSGKIGDSSMLCLVDGVLSNPFNLMLESRQDNKLRLKWECDELACSSRLHDKFCYILFDGERLIKNENTSVLRKDNNIEIDLFVENNVIPKSLFVYFVNEENTKYTQSTAIKL